VDSKHSKKNNKMFYCRLCGASLEPFDNILIFETFIDDVSLVEIIGRICYKIIVAENDGLPEKICSKCLDILKLSNELCEKSLITDTEFRMMCSQKVVKSERLDYEDEDFTADSNIIYETSIKNDISMSEAVVCETIMNLKQDEDAADEDDTKKVVEDANDKEIQNQFQCSICQKYFEKKSKLRRHMTIHDSSKKPFACTELDCLKRFEKSESLIRHQMIHQGKTIKNTADVSCTICSKQFNTQESLASHFRVHKNEMSQLKFPCNLCDKVFDKMNSLTRHSRTHAENKSYKCQVLYKLKKNNL
jgi:stress-induced morphogen